MILLLSFVFIASLFIEAIQEDVTISNLENEKETIQSAFENLSNELSELKKGLKVPPQGESVCKSLLGNYELDHEYVFSWDVDTKSIAAHDTNWQTTECICNEVNDFYI